MNNKQKQHLLAYLGYYNGEINGELSKNFGESTRRFQAEYGGLEVDGICGSKTQKAMKHAVAYGMPGKEKNDFWENIQYFKKEEFRCKCGKHCNGYPVEPSEELVKVLEKIRNYFGKPVIVNSGIRCATHNANVGGANASQHMKGTAADIVVIGIDPERVAKCAETLLPKTGGIGRYKTFTHIDVRPVMARWNG